MGMPAVIVFVGGGLGAIVRELFMLALGRHSAAFPLDIFAANILASFLLGLVVGLHQSHRVSDKSQLLVSTGFCGGLSTFSSFIYGAYSEMTTPGQIKLSLVYIFSSLVIGYGVTWLGLRTAMQLRRA